MSKRVPLKYIEPDNRRKRKLDEMTKKQPDEEDVPVEGAKWTPRPKVKKMQGKAADDAVTEEEDAEGEKWWMPRPKIERITLKTAEEAVEEIGGNISPLLRQGLEAIYMSEAEKKELNRRIDAKNESIELLNKVRRDMYELEQGMNALGKSMDWMLERSKYW